MDKLEQQLRESSEQVRHFEPPPGQWANIQEQLSQPAAGPASDGGATGSAGAGSGSGAGAIGPGIWWSGLLPIGLVVVSVGTWVLVRETKVLAEQKAPVPVSVLEQSDVAASEEADTYLLNPATDLSPATAAAAPTTIDEGNNQVASAAQIETTTTRATERALPDQQLASPQGPATYANATSLGVPATAVAASQERPLPSEMIGGYATTATSSDTDVAAGSTNSLAPRGTPVETTSSSPVSANSASSASTTTANYATAPLESSLLPSELTDFRTRQSERLQASLTPPTILPTAVFKGVNYSYDRENTPWRQLHGSGPRWEVDFHLLALPMGDFNSVSQYTTEVVPGETVFVPDFAGSSLELYRDREGTYQLSESWLTNFHAGVSRRFRNGIRLGFGLTYLSNDIIRGAIRDDNQGISSTEPEVYLRYSQDAGSLFFGSFEVEYMFWRRRRFRATIGGALILPISFKETYVDRLYHPFSDQDQILSRGTYIYDYVITPGVDLLPQLGLEYQLGRRTTLNLSAGARLGLGMRYRFGKP